MSWTFIDLRDAAFLILYKSMLSASRQLILHRQDFPSAFLLVIR